MDVRSSFLSIFVEIQLVMSVCALGSKNVELSSLEQFTIANKHHLLYVYV